jgi:hypothetical protein
MDSISFLHMNFISIVGPLIVCFSLSYISAVISNINWLPSEYDFSFNYERSKKEKTRCKHCGKYV